MKAYICELAHKDKQADTTSKTKSNIEKGFSRFSFNYFLSFP
jgi:hypothetical protein